MPTPASSAPPALGDAARCPCQSGLSYAECCGPFHRGDQAAPTAERLMRSRYSAFVTGDTTYLLATWHPTTRPASLELDPSILWRGLDIVRRSRGGMLDTDGTVEFVARYRSDGVAGEQREVSRFVREGRTWLYLDAS